VHLPENESLPLCKALHDEMKACVHVVSVCMCDNGEDDDDLLDASLFRDLKSRQTPVLYPIAKRPYQHVREYNQQTAGVILSRLLAMPTGEDTLARTLVCRTLYDDNLDADRVVFIAAAVRDVLESAQQGRSAHMVVIMALCAAAEIEKDQARVPLQDARVPLQDARGELDCCQQLEVAYAFASGVCEGVLEEISRVIVSSADVEEHGMTRTWCWEKVTCECVYVCMYVCMYTCMCSAAHLVLSEGVHMYACSRPQAGVYCVQENEAASASQTACHLQ
jgi:hypothetical protein